MVRILLRDIARRQAPWLALPAYTILMSTFYLVVLDSVVMATGLILLATMCVFPMVTEFFLLRSNAARALPISINTWGKVLWVLGVLAPPLVLTLALPLQLLCVQLDLLEPQILLYSLQIFPVYILYTATLFVAMMFFPILLPRQPSTIQQKFSTGIMVAAIAIFPAVLIYPQTQIFVWPLIQNHTRFICVLALLMLFISYKLAPHVARTQRNLPPHTEIGKAPRFSRTPLWTTTKTYPRAFLFFGALVLTIVFQTGTAQIMRTFATNEGILVLARGGFLGMASISVIAVSLHCIIGGRSLRALPLTQHALTRYVLSFPILTTLGMSTAYFLVLLISGVPLHTGSILSQGHLLLFAALIFPIASTLRMTLSLPILVVLDSLLWITHSKFETTSLSNEVLLLTLACFLAVAVFAYFLTYRCLLKGKHLYRPPALLLNVGRQ